MKAAYVTLKLENPEDLKRLSDWQENEDLFYLERYYDDAIAVKVDRVTYVNVPDTPTGLM